MSKNRRNCCSVCDVRCFAQTADAPCCLSMFRSALEGDHSAQQWIEDAVRVVLAHWLHAHPYYQAACSPEAERNFITQTFDRLWQTSPLQVKGCETLARAFQLLFLNLNGVLLDARRAVNCSHQSSGGSFEGQDEKRSAAQLWEQVKALLPTPRQQRITFLLLHCGLTPKQIVETFPDEFPHLQEVSRPRFLILEQLRQTEEFGFLI